MLTYFPVNSMYFISIGLNIGAMNMSVKGTPSTGDQSEYAPDANSGIWFYGNNFYLGASVNQVFNGKLQPYQEMSVLKRHYQFCGMKRFKLSELAGIKPAFLFRFPSYIDYNADYSLEADVSHVVFGVSKRNKLGGAFWVGITEFQIAGGNVDVVLTYTSPFKRSVVNLNSFELFCSYSFK
ncbi:MAG: type IX secretion system membrane protein PorP/SprF [Bacteroidales bacterium]|nr:type IX secretion system membrane protein PorP/SprF [Bacteroidales bacterium]